MRTEVPNVRRCCFCVPLRRGLLFWGYLHLVFSIFLTLMGLYVWWVSICFGATIGDLTVIEALILTAIYSIVTSVLLIYGAHRKNYKILKIQYYCVIVAEVALTVTIIAEASFSIRYYLKHIESATFLEWMYYSRSFFFVLLFGVGYIVFQLYVIVMVRSEVFKLRDIQQQFMFTNNAANAEANCTLYLNSESEGNKQHT